MTTMTPAAAREFWRALVDNAAGLIVDANTLYPTSPARAQALIVLAQEELGKSEWISEACWELWQSGSEEPVHIPRLKDHGRSHIEKFATADEASNDIRFLWTVPPDAQLGKAVTTTEQEVREYHRTFAREADADKQNGLYVDRRRDGTLSIPKEIKRPHLADEIVIAAQLCLQVMMTDAMLADVNLDCMPDMVDTYALVEPISESRTPPWGNR
jgi:AbiV family abortive infection protein